MNLPLEGRISGPNTGFEVTVPGRQGIRAMRHSIPLAGAPTSIATSLRGLLFFCSALFLTVVSRQRRAPCSIAKEVGTLLHNDNRLLRIILRRAAELHGHNSRPCPSSPRRAN